MKTAVVVSVVVAAHVIAVGLVMVVPGCGRTVREPMVEQETVMPKAVEQTETLPPRVPLAPKPVAKTWPSETTTYVVRPGDTLSQIAGRYDLNMAEIVALSGIENPDKVRVGDKIVLPGDLDVGAAPAMPKPAAKPAPKASAAVAGDRTYTVKAGDTLSHIAVGHGTTTAAIKQVNGLKNDLIRVGQKLVMPAGSAARQTPRPAKKPVSMGVPDAAPVTGDRLGNDPEPARSVGNAIVDAPTTVAPASTGATAYRSHTVEAGEDLFTIAMMYGVDYNALKSLNGLGEAELTAGQTLKIPMAE